MTGDTPSRSASSFYDLFSIIANRSTKKVLDIYGHSSKVRKTQSAGHPIIEVSNIK